MHIIQQTAYIQMWYEYTVGTHSREMSLELIGVVFFRSIVMQFVWWLRCFLIERIKSLPRPTHTHTLPPPPPPPPPLSRCGRPKVKFELLRMLLSNKMPIMCTSYRCVVHINTEDRWNNVLYECLAVRRLITPLYRFYPSSSLAPTKIHEQ